MLPIAMKPKSSQLMDQAFSREWWKEKFRQGKPLGHGAIALRDEDKMWWAGTRAYGWYMDLCEAIQKKWGQEAVKIIQETQYQRAKEIGAFLLDMLDIKERDAVTIAAVMCTQDTNFGHNVGIIDVAPDRTRATYYCSWCGLSMSGSAGALTLCDMAAPGNLKGNLEAVDPTGENIKVVKDAMGPPCIIVYESKKK